MKVNISASNVYIATATILIHVCTFNSLMVLSYTQLLRDMLLWYWASTQQHFDWSTKEVN